MTNISDLQQSLLFILITVNMRLDKARIDSNGKDMTTEIN